MKAELWKELGKQTLVSVGIYSFLFLILYIIEVCVPAWKGMLLKWDDAAFLVGIPASVAGTAYVLTIQNPKNYTGFFGAITMAVLLAWQFALLGNWDLVVLHFAVFIPFQTMSLLRWRKQALGNKEQGTKSQDILPSWLGVRGVVFDVLFTVGVVALDCWFISWMEGSEFTDGLLMKLMSGLMIAASVLANLRMIRKNINTWIWWIIYAIAGIVIYILTNNIFTLVLFAITLILNVKGAVAWVRINKYHNE